MADKNPNDPAPFGPKGFNKEKVKPDEKTRGDDGLSSQPQFSDYSEAPVGESEDAYENDPHEIAATIPPAGPSTIQELGVASTGKPSANQDDAGASPKK